MLRLTGIVQTVEEREGVSSRGPWAITLVTVRTVHGDKTVMFDLDDRPAPLVGQEVDYKISVRAKRNADGAPVTRARVLGDYSELRISGRHQTDPVSV